MTRIIVLDGYTENPGDLSWAGLEALGELTVYDRTPADKAAARIGGADIVYTNKTPITRATLGACPNIKMVSVLATGYNVVDVAACKEKGIPVTNIPAYGTAAVGQFAIALLLEICHRVGHHSEAVHQGRWENSGPRLLLRMMTPSFILAIFSLLMMPSVSGKSGQCRAITSASRSSVSNST